MPTTKFVVATLCVALAAVTSRTAQAQVVDSTNGSSSELTLDEAVATAIKHNPTHLSVVNDRRNATASRKAAYGALLPQFGANLSANYQQSGATPIQGVQFAVSSDVYQSFYSLGLSYTLNWASFVNPKLQNANVQAADADIVGSRITVQSTVTQDYLTVLQDLAKAQLQDTLIAQANLQLELAKAKLAVGSGTQLDVSKAQVTLGQAQVAALQVRNQVEIDKLRLYQEMGVPEPASVQLTTQFTVQPPSFTVDSVLALARQMNPTLNALRVRSHAAALNVSAQRGSYFPTLQLSTGISGFTYQFANSDFLVDQYRQGVAQSAASCFTTDSLRVGAGLPSIASQCAGIVFDPQHAAQIRSANKQFPFNFTRQPFGVSAQLSLPIFNGFQREQQIEQAEASRNDADYRTRAQELQLTADVTAAYLTLGTQVQTVKLQQQNAAQAREGLDLAEVKYRAGAATFLDISDAQATFSQAENDYINAVYQFHKAFAALESAVGHPLR